MTSKALASVKAEKLYADETEIIRGAPTTQLGWLAWSDQAKTVGLNPGQPFPERHPWGVVWGRAAVMASLGTAFAIVIGIGAALVLDDDGGNTVVHPTCQG
jgi:hypothetical protein